MSRPRARVARTATLLALWAAALSGAASPSSRPASRPASDQPIGWATVGGATTGGRGGPITVIKDGEAFVEAVRGDAPSILHVSGTLRLPATARLGSNKTIFGLGADAKITGAGLMLRKVHNVIIRNLTISDVDPDAIGIQDHCEHIWVDHCDLSRAHDGLLDITKSSDLITVSWNHFHDHHKTCLLGHSDKPAQLALDKGKLRVTYHHNFFDGTLTRHPRARAGDGIHVFNNYFRNNDYGVASLQDAGVLVEGNCFEHVPHPTYTLYGESKSPGRLVARDNLLIDSGTPDVRGTVPEPRDAYPYTLDPAADVAKIVSERAGVGKVKP